MNTFGTILYQCRQEQKQTQKQFIDELAAYNEEFISLTPVTLSRWENGTTETSLYRKRLILKYIHSKGLLQIEPCRTLIRDRYNALYTPLSKVFEHNYESLIHNLPKLRISLEEYERSTLKECNDDDRLQHIIDIESASHAPHYYKNTPKSIKELIENPASYSIIIERNGQHLGHFMMYKVHSEVSKKIIEYRLKEHELSIQDLCPIDKKGDYYIHALYGVNPLIASILNVDTYLYLFDNIDTINNIVIFSSRKDGLRLAKAYGIEVIKSGEDMKYGVSWSGMRSPLEDILFSDTVLKLVF